MSRYHDRDAREADFLLVHDGGLHAIEHAAIGILPLFAMCDRQDIGGYSTEYHVETAKPQIFIYDAHPGGIGIAEKGYEFILELWQRTLELITECSCQDGCPGCIQSPKCGNNNVPLDKEAARMTLQLLVEQATATSCPGSSSPDLGEGPPGPRRAESGSAAPRRIGPSDR